MTGAIARKLTGMNAQRLTDSDYRQLAEFRYLLRRFLAFSETAAERTGLTAQQHQALLAIKGFPNRQGQDAIGVGALAERLGIRHHSAVGLIDRLASSGLVRRKRNEEDRRQVLIALTAKADALLARLSLAHRDELKRLAPTLRQILRRI
jgi:DNA-binding MarR family transcriptional regulator